VAAYGATLDEEIGSSGRNATRIREVIEARHPVDNVELREKLSLIYEVAEWFPHEIHRMAGIDTYTSPEEWQERGEALRPDEREQRVQQLRHYLKSLDLDVALDVERLADFAHWKFASAPIHDFFFGRTPPERWRQTNVRYFQPRADLLRSPWIQRPETKQQRPIEVGSHDPAFAGLSVDDSLADYEPKYRSMQSQLLNGTCFYTVRDGWMESSGADPEMIAMTGPSGTADNFIRLAQIFRMSLDQKLGMMKALIGTLHLDDHHSIHEIMLASAGDADLNARIAYGGTPEALSRLDEGIHRRALMLQPLFLQREAATRNRLSADQAALTAEGREEDASCSWLQRDLDDLDDRQKLQLNEVLENTLLVHKNDPETLAEYVDSFPIFSPHIRHIENVREEFSCESVSATLLLPSAPTVATYTWHNNLHYGMILDPEAMTPMLAGMRDLASENRFASQSFSKGSWRAMDSTSSHLFEGRPVVNVGPDGELCQSMGLIRRTMVHKMLSNSDENHILMDGKLLSHNEMMLAMDGDSQTPACKGVFVDLVSISLKYSAITKLYHKPVLNALTRIVPLRTWLEVAQSRNLKRLQDRPNDYTAMRQLAIDRQLPFFVRYVDERGLATFHEADIAASCSITELAQRHGVTADQRYPVLSWVLGWFDDTPLRAT
jgi:hypothetical protein